MSIFEQIHAHPAVRTAAQILILLAIAGIITLLRRAGRELGRSRQSHTYQARPQAGRLTPARRPNGPNFPRSQALLGGGRGRVVNLTPPRSASPTPIPGVTFTQLPRASQDQEPA